MDKIDYNKYEKYIRIGHNATKVNGEWVCSDLQDFPTPSELGRILHDVDVDAFTDLKGYTHRNRVRHDVEDITLTYFTVADRDESYMLNRISPAWVYVELTDKKTLVNVTDSNGYLKYAKKITNTTTSEVTLEGTYWYDASNEDLYEEVDGTYTEVTTFNLADYQEILVNAKKVHKMYASDKEWNTFRIIKTGNGQYYTQDIDFSFSLVEE